MSMLCRCQDESGQYDYQHENFGNMTNMQYCQGWTDIGRQETSGQFYTTNYQYGRYRGDSQMTQCTYGNGLEDNRSYDLQGRLVSQQLADALTNITDQRTYSYDKNSNILNIDTNTEDNGYVYDRLDRLTSDNIDDNNPFTYGYDLNDNRLSRQQGTGTEELDEWVNYIDNSNRIAQIDTFQRNAILSDLPNREIIYNDAGRLYQLIEANILKASYIYNDMGQRTRKTIYQSDGTTVDSVTIYHYDRMGMLVTETTETGVLMKDYVWNGGVIAAQITNTVSPDESNTESIVYLYTDHLMTNRLATDDNQQVVWRWEGEAFGNTPAEELGGVSVNLRFPGQYYDQETNLHYNHHRYYDPVLGRYITSDPVGLQAGINTYNYVNANPNRYLDINGLRITVSKCSDEQEKKIRDAIGELKGRYIECEGLTCDDKEKLKLVFDDLIVTCTESDRHRFLKSGERYCGLTPGLRGRNEMILTPLPFKKPKWCGGGKGLIGTILHEGLHNIGYPGEEDPLHDEVRRKVKDCLSNG